MDFSHTGFHQQAEALAKEENNGTTEPHFRSGANVAPFCQSRNFCIPFFRIQHILMPGDKFGARYPTIKQLNCVSFNKGCLLFCSGNDHRRHDF